MASTPTGRRNHRQVQLIRQSLLQSDSLPFADTLTPEHIQQAFQDNACPFRQRDDDANDDANDDASDSSQGGQQIVYTSAVTLWAMLSQALFTDKLRACVAAVQRVAVYYACWGVEVSATNTGAYCRAKAAIPAAVVKDLAQGLAERCEAAVPDKWLWHGHPVKAVDGATFSMEDTPANQAAYPQSTSQKPGLGFPILRAVAVTSLATGMVLAAEVGPYAGKETGENALFRKLLPKLHQNDLVVADRHYGGWFMLALLQERGVEFVTALHQMRKADFSQGQRLAKGDHIVSWTKSVKPDWLDQETFDRLPEQLTVREVEVKVEVKGFRTQSLVVVTSLIDPELYPTSEIAALYWPDENLEQQ